MENMDRRSALAFGLATAATLPALLIPTAASAQRYRRDEGSEIAPGVRRVDVSKRASEIPGYATVSMSDAVFQPGSKTTGDSPMPNDMVCHCLESELQVSQRPGKQFVAKTGDVWSCRKGQSEAVANNGSTMAIMRRIILIPPA